MDFINDRGIDADVIVMSGEVGIDAAIGALKRGAYDYLRKPYSREELLKTVSNALGQRRLALDNARIAHAAGEFGEAVPLPGRQRRRTSSTRSTTKGASRSSTTAPTSCSASRAKS